MLVQAARQEGRASGRAELRFIGHDQSAKRSMTLSELGPEKHDPLLFSFRRFQEFSGEFRLPAGFTPQKAVVTLMFNSGHDPQVEEEFEWGKIQVGTARGTSG